MSRPRNHPKIQAVDLFCGAGGLTYGLRQAGVDVRIGVDNAHHCKYIYEVNNRATFLERSVLDVHADDLASAFEGADFRLLAGCAPCQTFSKYNQKAKTSDARWELLSEFGRLVREVRPDIVSMENVPGLAKRHVFHRFVRTLRELGYHVGRWIVNCPDYGVPQTRQRLLLLASRFAPIVLDDPSRYRRATVRSVIGGLPPLAAGESDPVDPLHFCAALSPMNMRRIRASRPGGSWRDWPEELVAPCHLRDSGHTYVGVYGRMEWDKPAPTMTTQYFGFGNGRFGHPEQDRGLSIREGAMLQTFPRDYQFLHPGERRNISALGRMIGNAVPPKLGEVIGNSIYHHLDSIAEKGIVIHG